MLNSTHTVLLRRFACHPAAFLAVRRSQTESESSLAEFKLHTARVRVCIGLAELIEVSYGVGSFWYCSVKIKAPIRPYNGQNQGIIFVSDPQLRGSTKNVAEKSGGKRRQKVEIIFNFVDEVEIPVLAEPIIAESTLGRRKTA